MREERIPGEVDWMVWPLGSEHPIRINDLLLDAQQEDYQRAEARIPTPEGYLMEGA